MDSEIQPIVMIIPTAKNHKRRNKNKIKRDLNITGKMLRKMIRCERRIRKQEAKNA